MFTSLKTNCLLMAGALLVQCTTNQVNVIESEDVIVETKTDGGKIGVDFIISLDPSSFGDLFGSKLSEITNPSADQLDNLANLLDSDDLTIEEIDALESQLKDCRTSLARCKIVSEGVEGVVEPSGGKKTPESPVFGANSHGAISVSPPPPKCSLGSSDGATSELAISESIEGCRLAGGTQCSLLVSWINECVAVAVAPTCKLYYAVGKDLSDLEQRVLSRCREFHEECFIPDQASFCTPYEGRRPAGVVGDSP